MQECIKLVRSDSKDIYIVTKEFWKKANIKQHNN